MGSGWYIAEVAASPFQEPKIARLISDQGIFFTLQTVAFCWSAAGQYTEHLRRLAIENERWIMCRTRGRQGCRPLQRKSVQSEATCRVRWAQSSFPNVSQIYIFYYDYSIIVESVLKRCNKNAVEMGMPLVIPLWMFKRTDVSPSYWFYS